MSDALDFDIDAQDGVDMDMVIDFDLDPVVDHQDAQKPPVVSLDELEIMDFDLDPVMDPHDPPPQVGSPEEQVIELPLRSSPPVDDTPGSPPVAPGHDYTGPDFEDLPDLELLTCPDLDRLANMPTGRPKKARKVPPALHTTVSNMDRLLGEYVAFGSEVQVGLRDIRGDARATEVLALQELHRRRHQS